MNVLVLSHMFPNPATTTSGIFVLEQMRALRKRGIKISAIAPTPWAPRGLRWLARVRKYAAIPLHGGVDRFQVTYPRILTWPGPHLFWLYPWLYYLRCRSLVRCELQQPGIDLIHAHTVMPDGFAAVLLGREFDLPVVCTVHGSDVKIYPRRSWATRSATKWSLSRVTRVIAVSRDLKQCIEALTGGCNVTVIENGADSTFFQPIPKQEAREYLGLPRDRKILLYAGNLVEVKGVDYLLQAFARLRRVGTLLCVVGDGTLKSHYINIAASLGVLSDCRFMGRRPHEELPQIFSAADCLVLPSLSEGFPTVLPEAMMCRVPVISTAVGGVPEIVKHCITGFLVPARDSGAMAEAIETVLTADADQLNAMLNRAEAAARRSFTWDENARRTAEVYEHVLQFETKC